MPAKLISSVCFRYIQALFTQRQIISTLNYVGKTCPVFNCTQEVNTVAKTRETSLRLVPRIQTGFNSWDKSQGRVP